MVDFPSVGLTPGTTYTSGWSTWMWDGAKWMASVPSGGVYVPMFGGPQFPMTGFLYQQTIGDPGYSTVWAGFGATRWRFKINAGDDLAAGSIDYRGYDATALSIVGAGTTTGRKINLYDNVAVNGTLSIGGVTTIGGGVSVVGGVGSTGAVAQISWQDRTLPAITWLWYSSGGITRLYQGADRLWLDGSGNLYTQGSHVVGGNSLYFTGAALGAAGPRVYADTTNMAFQTGTGNGAWFWYTNPGATALSLSNAGALTAASSINSGNDITFKDRSGTPQWVLYSQGNIARLWNAGDRITVDSAGNFTAGGNITQGSTYHYFMNGTGAVNAAGGPFIYVDTSYIIPHLGVGNQAFIIQDKDGVNRHTFTGTGAATIGTTLRTGGDVAVGGGNLYLANAAFGTNGPRLSANTTDIVLQTGSGNGSFFLVDNVGNSRFQMDNAGAVQTGNLRISGSGDYGVSTTQGSFTRNYWRFAADHTLDGAQGSISYRSFDANAMCIVGAGLSPNRSVHLWDSVTVDNSLTVNSNLTVGGSISSGGLISPTLPALGTTIGSQVLALRLGTTTANQDRIEFLWSRSPAGTDWTTADFIIRRNVDFTNSQTSIVFGGQTTFVVLTANAYRFQIDATNMLFRLPAGNGGYYWYNSGGFTTAMTLSAAGALTCANTVATTGSNAMLQFASRDGLATWGWYASGNIARLWKADVGDRFSVDYNANANIYGDAYVTGNTHVANYLFFLNGVAAPYIQGDATNIIARMGGGNGGFYVQDNSGINRVYALASGELWVGGNIHFANTLYFLNSVNPPYITADITNFVFRIGAGSGGWYFQNNAGNANVAYITAGGVLYCWDVHAGGTMFTQNLYLSGGYIYFNNVTSGGPALAVNTTDMYFLIGTGNGSHIFVNSDGNWRSRFSSGQLALYGGNNRDALLIYKGDNTSYMTLIPEAGTHTAILGYYNTSLGWINLRFTGQASFDGNVSLNQLNVRSTNIGMAGYTGGLGGTGGPIYYGDANWIVFKPGAGNLGAMLYDYNGQARVFLRTDGTVWATGTGSLGQFRMMMNPSGSGYGSAWYNDGSNTYLLLTNNNDSQGGYNGLRPFIVNMGNGDITHGHSATINGNLTVGARAYINGGYLALPNSSTGNFLDIYNPGATGWLHIFDDGNAHIESNTRIWMNQQSGADVYMPALVLGGNVTTPNTVIAGAFLIYGTDHYIYNAGGGTLTHRAGAGGGALAYFDMRSNGDFSHGGWHYCGAVSLPCTAWYYGRDTAGTSQPLCAIWNDNHAYYCDSSRPAHYRGSQVFIESPNGRIEMNNNVRSNGGSAGWIFQDRNAGFDWQWYAVNSVARLWSSADGDRLTCDRGGSFYASGNISCGGSLFGWDVYASSGVRVNGLWWTNNGGWWWTGSPIHTDSAMTAGGNMNCWDLHAGGGLYVNSLAGLVNNGGWWWTGSPIHTDSEMQCSAITIGGHRIQDSGGWTYCESIHAAQVYSRADIWNAGNINAGNDFNCPNWVRAGGGLAGGPGNAGFLLLFNAGSRICFRWDGQNAFYRVDEAVEHRISRNNGYTWNEQIGSSFYVHGGGELIIYADQYSDARMKDNIRTTEVDALAALCAIPVRAFELNDLGHRYMVDAPRQVPIGLVAQEVRAGMPYVVDARPTPNTDLPLDDPHRIAYERMDAYYVRAFQQLLARNEELVARIEELESRFVVT